MATKEEALEELYEQLKAWDISNKRFAQIMDRIRQLEDNG